MIAGQPPRTVAAGEGFVILAGTVHNAKNDGASATKLVGVDVVEKGKPLASPASAPTPCATTSRRALIEVEFDGFSS